MLVEAKGRTRKRATQASGADKVERWGPHDAKRIGTAEPRSTTVLAQDRCYSDSLSKQLTMKTHHYAVEMRLHVMGSKHGALAPDEFSMAAF